MMSPEEFLAEYRRRVQESIVALLRERADIALQELPSVLAEVPELRSVKLAELFAPPSKEPSKPAPAPPSAAARIAAYLLDSATSAGAREAGGVGVRVPSHTKIGERVAATPESVALTLAILARRNVIDVHPLRIVVRDLRGLALIAGRAAARHDGGHT